MQIRPLLQDSIDTKKKLKKNEREKTPVKKR